MMNDVKVKSEEWKDGWSTGNNHAPESPEALYS